VSNVRVGEHAILSWHFRASTERVKAYDGSMLILQNTTTFSYRRERPELTGTRGKDDLLAKKLNVSATAARAIRDPDAFESYCRRRWIATLPGYGEILDKKTLGQRTISQSHTAGSDKGIFPAEMHLCPAHKKSPAPKPGATLHTRHYCEDNTPLAGVPQRGRETSQNDIRAQKKTRTFMTITACCHTAPPSPMGS
jgi:hypothetical protein